MDTKQWYVLQSKPHKEVAVCAQLQRVTDEIEVFFPKIRNHIGIKPLFPSYLFVRALMDDAVNYRLLRYTRGVLRIVGSREGSPIPVEESVVNMISSRLGPDGLIDQRKFFQMGQSVRVQRGPLKDLIGILEKPVSEEGRVRVLFKLLKYPIRAVLRFEDLMVVGSI